jgi:four helix bundle protein
MPVWQSAMNAAESVFRLSDILPKKEDYGLTSQIRRSALSISANIAEAFGREHALEKINFYYFSRGSLTETRSHLDYGQRVGYFNEEMVRELDMDLIALHHDLNKLIQSMMKKQVEGKGRLRGKAG